MLESHEIRRENYCKYGMVHKKLLEYLEDGVSAKFTAKELHISLPTYYKYKSIATIETGKIFVSPEEIAFMERQKNIKEINNKPKQHKKSASAITTSVQPQTNAKQADTDKAPPKSTHQESPSPDPKQLVTTTQNEE
jgi:hypothetical protein